MVHLLLCNGGLIGLNFNSLEDIEYYYFNDSNDFFDSDEYIEELKKHKEKSDKLKRKKQINDLNNELNKAINNLEKQRHNKEKKDLPILLSSKDILEVKDTDKKTNKEQENMLNSLVELFRLNK